MGKIVGYIIGGISVLAGVATIFGGVEKLFPKYIPPQITVSENDGKSKFLKIGRNILNIDIHNEEDKPIECYIKVTTDIGTVNEKDGLGIQSYTSHTSVPVRLSGKTKTSYQIIINSDRDHAHKYFSAEKESYNAFLGKHDYFLQLELISTAGNKPIYNSKCYYEYTNMNAWEEGFRISQDQKNIDYDGEHRCILGNSLVVQ